MTRPSLSLVGAPAGYETKSRAEKLAWIKAECEHLNDESIGDASAMSADFIALLRDIAACHHKDGVREEARRLAEHNEARMGNLLDLAGRRS